MGVICRKTNSWVQKNIGGGGLGTPKYAFLNMRSVVRWELKKSSLEEDCDGKREIVR